jgi:porphobilinogen synthase
MRLIQPIFASYSTRETGLGKDNKIYNAWKEVNERVKKDIDLGVKEFLLFYIPEFKLGEKSDTHRGDEHIDSHKFDQLCVTSASLSRDIQPHCRLIVDICLCSYTHDGHCCITGDQEKTDRLLLDQAKSVYTASGATLAPSDCQDNTVKNIKSLKEGGIEVMSYSTKFRSTFYRGWRNAMKIEKGIHRPYQLDVSDRQGALHRSIKYKDDGADELMVKPGMTSLDLIGDIKMFSHKPTGVYQTSGEYLGIGAPGSLLETYKVFERAGADFMITYGARDLVGKV